MNLKESFRRNKPQIAALLTKTSIIDILQSSDSLNITDVEKDEIIEVYCSDSRTKTEATNAFLTVISKTFCIDPEIRLQKFCKVLRECNLRDEAKMIDGMDPPAEAVDGAVIRNFQAPVQHAPNPSRPIQVAEYNPDNHHVAQNAFSALISFLERFYFTIPENVSGFRNWLLRQGRFVNCNFHFRQMDSEQCANVDQIINCALDGKLFHKDNVDELLSFLDAADAPYNIREAVHNYKRKWIPQR